MTRSQAGTQGLIQQQHNYSRVVVVGGFMFSLYSL